jgi:hypothetical protein
MSQPQIQTSSESDVEIESSQPEAQETEQTEVSEQSQAQGQPQEQEFNPKQRVEFSTPEQQKKFNDIYKQARMSDARNKMQEAMLQKAMEKISDLESRFSQTDQAEAERILTSRLKEARDSGDEDKADKILQEIIDFRVDRKISAKQPEKPIAVNPADDADVQTVVSLATETDERGAPVRPWIAQGHPKHNEAMKLAGALALQVQAELGYTDVAEVFRRMDDAMKPKAAQPQGNSRAADPMRGNLTNRPTQGKIKLSPAELNAAQKLGVKPEDYLKWKR